MIGENDCGAIGGMKIIKCICKYFLLINKMFILNQRPFQECKLRKEIPGAATRDGAEARVHNMSPLCSEGLTSIPAPYAYVYSYNRSMRSPSPAYKLSCGCSHVSLETEFHGFTWNMTRQIPHKESLDNLKIMLLI
jgi:hypothetical protein